MEFIPQAKGDINIAVQILLEKSKSALVVERGF